MLSISIAIQLAASSTSIASIWFYGNASKYGPLIGFFSQIFWWSMMFYDGLYGLLPVNIVMFGLHMRNYLKLRKKE